jgi:hypothetical protein
MHRPFPHLEAKLATGAAHPPGAERHAEAPAVHESGCPAIVRQTIAGHPGKHCRHTVFAGGHEEPPVMRPTAGGMGGCFSPPSAASATWDPRNEPSTLPGGPSSQSVTIVH